MPSKVITRRQRKAAEEKRKAAEEARQNAGEPDKASSISFIEDSKRPSPLLENGVVGSITLTKQPKGKDLRHQSEPITKMFKGPEGSCVKQVKIKGKSPSFDTQDCIKRAATNIVQTVLLKEQRPSSNNTLDIKKIFNTTSWSDDLKSQEVEPELTTVKSVLETSHGRVTTASVFPLVAKICKQIKSHINKVLKKRSGVVAKENPKRKIVQQRHFLSKSQLKKLRKVLIKQKERRLILLGHGRQNHQLDQDPMTDHKESAQRAKAFDPNVSKEFVERLFKTNFNQIPPPTVFGNTGYFALTGTENQLRQQLTELSDRNVIVQSCIQLPSPLMDKVEKQLKVLVTNREKVIETMN